MAEQGLVGGEMAVTEGSILVGGATQSEDVGRSLRGRLSGRTRLTTWLVAGFVARVFT